MKPLTLLLAGMLLLAGCSETKAPVADRFRGNPIAGTLSGTLLAAGSPYLATGTLRVLPNTQLKIEQGVELRFETGISFEVRGKITAVGSEAAPITFTSGQKYPSRGDWDGLWLIGADPASRFEYCRFLFGAKYGRHYSKQYRYVYGSDSTIVDSTLVDSSLVEYGSLTLKASSPTVLRCWFLANGFHGLHCDSASNPLVENSVFYDNAGHGVFVHWDADPQLNNNIITENDDYGVFCAQPDEGFRDNLKLNYSIVWSNFSGEFNTAAPRNLGRIARANANLDSCDAQFNLRLNPEFADPDNGDFRLTSCSGAIEAGPGGLDLGIFPYTYRRGEIRRLVRVDELEATFSPYTMSCDLLLPAGRTLTIKPGVEIRVEGRYQFRIKGQLLSQGTAALPVTFLSAAAEPAKGDWVGLFFESGDGAGSVLTNTTISHARWGVRLSGQDAVIDHCTISECDSVGVFAENMSAPTIMDCRISDNSIAGVLTQFNSTPRIVRNIITGGAGYGILARASSRPVILNNIIAGVGTDAIRFENLSSGAIHNNVLANNGYYGLYCFNNSWPDVRNNIFYHNGSLMRGGVGVYATTSSFPVIAYNSFWGHPLSAVSLSSDTTAYDSASTLMLNPMFVNPAAGDWHLQMGSPCIDAGDSMIFDRGDRTRSDMGAYGGPDSE